MIEDREQETDLEGRFVRAVEALGCQVRKLVFDGSGGAPDRLVLMPGGRAAFVELKNGRRGRVAPLQAREIRILQSLGFDARVIRDDHGIEVFLHEVVR